VKPYLLDEEDTVGTQVNVRHLAAAPLGSEVSFLAEVTGIEKRRVTFRVEAWDGQEKIGEGTHERAVINVARFAEKLRAKRS
jgi:fluoroacetyl-CoA thioesterase